MQAETFLRLLGADFYTGVPDSQLKALCNCLTDTWGVRGSHHIIAANEGNAAALAAGYYLATGKPAAVYLQNSGEGNIINPVASLCNEQVYGIPMMFVVGWRGQPGIHDEPQHIYQGQITLKLLQDMDIASAVIGPETTEEELRCHMEQFRPLLQAGKQIAFVVKKGGLSYGGSPRYENGNLMLREKILSRILAYSGEDPIVSTTGKASRELFELRQQANQDHSRDFLTVGSMGHSSSIALGIALQKPDTRVWCVDGDGAVLMHMGAMAIIGARKPENLIHIVINNGAHETVGGMPTAAADIDLPAIARGCGYGKVFRAETFSQLDEALAAALTGGELTFIEAVCAIGSRPDLGRPTTTPGENKAAFMAHLQEISSGR